MQKHIWSFYNCKHHEFNSGKYKLLLARLDLKKKKKKKKYTFLVGMHQYLVNNYLYYGQYQLQL